MLPNKPDLLSLTLPTPPRPRRRPAQPCNLNLSSFCSFSLPSSLPPYMLKLPGFVPGFAVCRL